MRTETDVEGTVCQGEGRSRHELTEEEVQAVASTVGWWPYYGTLNIRPTRSLRLGQAPDLETASGRWWMGWLKCARVGLSHVAIVRQRPERPEMEVMAPLNLRLSWGLKDGDVLSFRPHTPSGG